MNGRNIVRLAAVGAAFGLTMGTASADSLNALSANATSMILWNGYAGLCLDARTDATWNPGMDRDPVQLYSCTGTVNQYWFINSNGTITNAVAGLCLDARDDATWNPTMWRDPVQLHTCNGQENQQWHDKIVGGSSEIVNGYGLELDAENDATWNPSMWRDPVQLYPDSSGATPDEFVWGAQT
jgi:Ricin-type beta-trefoil lectin domain